MSWNCPACTLLNTSAVDNCIVCGTSKLNKKWNCQYCTFENKTSLEYCGMCNKLQFKSNSFFQQLTKQKNMFFNKITMSDGNYQLIFTKYNPQTAYNEKTVWSIGVLIGLTITQTKN